MLLVVLVLVMSDGDNSGIVSYVARCTAFDTAGVLQKLEQEMNSSSSTTTISITGFYQWAVVNAVIGPVTVAEHAVNGNGRGLPAVTDSVPVPPTAPTAITAYGAVSITGDSLSVVFSAPADGGSPITHYTAVTSPGGVQGKYEGNTGEQYSEII